MSRGGARDSDRSELVESYLRHLESGGSETPEAFLAARGVRDIDAREVLRLASLLEGAGGASPETRRPGFPPEIAGYRIIREIGRGGMGVVYEAEQIRLGRTVALKFLSLGFSPRPNAVRRFQREARAAGQIRHPNIVPVHDLDRQGGYWFYVMELIDGRPLNRVIDELRGGDRRPSSNLAVLGTGSREARRSVPAAHRSEDRAWFARVARMFANVANALELAHHQGVVHRDIKPGNLLLASDGSLKIVDFGLACIEDGGPPMTLTGDLLGTPGYMSPEQVEAKRIPIDHRTDVYSLGATLYEVLTLEPPFSGEALQDVCSQILTRDPVLPRRRDRRIPRDLETIALKAMEKEREGRYPSARAMAVDLEAFAQGAAIRTRPVGPIGRGWRRIRRRKVRWALAALSIFLLVLTTFLGSMILGRAGNSVDAEYLRLCMAGEEEAAWRIEGAPGYRPGAALELFDRAIALRPDRPEAYYLRARFRGHGIREDDIDAFYEAKFADLDEALARGLPERTYHYARAQFLRIRGNPEDAQVEIDWARACPDGSVHDIFYEARLAADEGRLMTGCELLTRAIGTSGLGDATRKASLQLRGLLRKQIGDLAGALEDYHALRSMGSRKPRVLIGTASCSRGTGREAEAELIFREALDYTRSIGTRQAWVSLVRACDRHGEDSFLERTATEAVREVGDDDELTAYRAVALARLGRAREAREVVEDVLGSEAGNHYALRICAGALERLGRPEEAKRAHERALEGDPDCLATLTDLARLGAACGEDRPDQVLQGLIARHPGDLYLRFGRGRARLEREEFRTALEDFDEAAQEAFPGADLWRGRTLCAMGRFEEALAALRVAVTRDPLDAEPLADLALLLASCPREDLRDAVAALRLARRATRLESAPPRAWTALGAARCRNADWEGAAEALGEAALRRGAPDAESLSYLAMACAMQGRPQEARDALAKARERLREDPRLAVTLGLVILEAEGVVSGD